MMMDLCHLRANDLTAHGSLCSIDKAFFAQAIHLDGHLISNELACHLGCQTIASDDSSRMNLVLDQLIGSLQKLGCNNHHGCCTIAHLTVLLLSQLDKHLACGMFHFQELKNCRAIVADGDILAYPRKRVMRWQLVVHFSISYLHQSRQQASCQDPQDPKSSLQCWQSMRQQVLSRWIRDQNIKQRVDE